MTLLVPNPSLSVVLQIILNKDAPEELDLKIFQNDYTPVATSAVGDFTEATFTGYADVELDSAEFSTPTTADPSVSTYSAPENFASTANQSSQDCYGYYIIRRVTGDLVWAERFTDGPYNILNDGDNFNVTPRITLGNSA
jgi:hypothetical protein